MGLREVFIAFWPLFVLQFILTVSALVSIARRGKTKKLPKVAWVLIVLFISIFGAIIYFLVGKGDAKDDELYRD
ncbi:MAG TPA: PLDc_N domain-containing protein [Firmicutes bacterium]|nr:PLDc_N domain-containing protein [Bacillota bacterium]